MNATHDDWERARERRNSAAYAIALAYRSGTLEALGHAALERFTEAESEMERIEKELDGRADA